MKYKYQLITLGSNVPERQIIIDQIKLELESLSLPEEFIKVIPAYSIETEYKGNQPAFALYFGDTDGNFKDLDVTQKFLKGRTMILPIFYNSFNADIPYILSNNNAIQYSANEINRISNIVLEAFELLRSTRKVFISYRRSESTAVAIQLYEALEGYNFDVFLDTHSIHKGDPFQDELWHRMADCDVIVLLNTTGFLESHWCKEEFAEANAKQIGIVQLVWPNHQIKDIDKSSHISYPLQLKEDDFVNKESDSTGRFIESMVVRVLTEVESIRARNLAARQDSLITEFRNITEKNKRKVTVQPEKILTEDLSNGEHIIYIPTIGIPQSTSYQSAEIKKELMEYDEVSIRLIYDDLRIRDKWLKHLEWLNDNFKKDIKTLKKQDFELWLQKT